MRSGSRVRVGAEMFAVWPSKILADIDGDELNLRTQFCNCCVCHGSRFGSF